MCVTCIRRDIICNSTVFSDADTTGKDTTNITDLSDIMEEYELQQASENQSGQSMCVSEVNNICIE